MCVRAMLVLHHPLLGLCADVCQGNISITHTLCWDYVQMCVRAMLVLHHPLLGLCADVCQGNVSITSHFARIMCSCVSGKY